MSGFVHSLNKWITLRASCVRCGKISLLLDTKRTLIVCGWFDQRVAHRRPNLTIMKWWATTRFWVPTMTNTSSTTVTSALKLILKTSVFQKVSRPFTCPYFCWHRHVKVLVPLYIKKYLINFFLGISCGPFPGPGVEHRILANPIQDLIQTSPVGHAHRLFGHFKEKYERNYEDEEEHEKREHNFVHNIRWGKNFIFLIKPYELYSSVTKCWRQYVFGLSVCLHSCNAFDYSWDLWDLDGTCNYNLQMKWF